MEMFALDLGDGNCAGAITRRFKSTYMNQTHNMWGACNIRHEWTFFRSQSWLEKPSWGRGGGLSHPIQFL